MSKSKSYVVEMNPEREERFTRIGEQIIDILRAEVSPAEALAILTFLTESLCSTHGFKGAYTIDKGERFQ